MANETQPTGPAPGNQTESVEPSLAAGADAPADGVALVGLVAFGVLVAVQLVNICTSGNVRERFGREAHLLAGGALLAVFYGHAVTTKMPVERLVGAAHWAAYAAAAVPFLHLHCRVYKFRRRRFVRFLLLMTGGLVCAAAAREGAGALYVFGIGALSALCWATTVAFARSGVGRASQNNELHLPCVACDRRDRAALFFYAPLVAVLAAGLGSRGWVRPSSGAAWLVAAELFMASTAAENTWVPLRSDLLSDSSDDDL